MPASVFDSVIYRGLLQDADTAELFSDAAELRALTRVEAALAKIQGELGLIPAASAQVIVAGLAQLEIDPASLAASTADDGIPVPALVAALRDAIGAPEHAQYLHWGATSQDIMDTGLMLRLSGLCDLVERRLQQLLQVLAQQAEIHAELPLAARTRGQLATPTSFGAVIAAWGAPLFNHLEVLAQQRPRLLRISLAGASGNSSALGKQAAALRTALARELGLADSKLPWHSERSSLAEFASLLTRIGGSLAKMAEDHLLATRPEAGELELPTGGGSSTMPHKHNPVVSETLLGLFHTSAAMDGLMTQAMLHRQQRDGSAWMLEWFALPQISMATARALALALELAQELQPRAEVMAARLGDSHELVYAEAISFKMTEWMSRPQAQAEVKRLCAQAAEQGCALSQLAARDFPDIDWSAIVTPAAQFGDAADQAHAFVARVRQMKSGTAA